MPRSRLAVATRARSLPGAHRRFDLAPRFEREAAVVDADAERLVVDLPQILENQLGEAAGVAEDQRGLVRFDQLHHLAGGIAARMAGPRNLAFGDEDREIGLGAGIAFDEVDGVDVGVGREPAAIGFGVGDGRAEADPAKAGAKRLQADKREAQQVAALFLGEGVDFVDDDGLEAGEQRRAIGIAQEQA